VQATRNKSEISKITTDKNKKIPETIAVNQIVHVLLKFEKRPQN
jgi:hypothetical protein